MKPRDPFVEKWLLEFNSLRTQKNYRTALRRYSEVMCIANFEEYIKTCKNIPADIRKYLQLLNGKPAKTIITYVGAVKVFLQDNGSKIPDAEWRKIRRRGFIPKNRPNKPLHIPC